MSRRYCIIGSGVAALAAAEVIRARDPAGTLTLIGDDPDGYYSRPGIAYYLNRMIPEQQLFPRSPQQLHELFPIRIHAHVVSIATATCEVLLHDGRRVAYDRLLIATGARPYSPPFPGDDLPQLVNLDTLDDVRRILHLARRGRRAVVVGGGVIAIELAEGLAARGMVVHQFVRRDSFWWPVLDHVESQHVQHGLEEASVRVHFKTEVAEARAKNGKLSEVITKAGARLPCSVLGLAAGVRPDKDLGEKAGLATEKGILVDEYLETSAAGVFAAGNVAQVRDPETGGTWLETLWDTARIQGEVAGANMTGERQVCSRVTPYNAVRVGGIVVTTIGSMMDKATPDVVSVVANDAHRWRIVPQLQVHHGDRVNRVRVMVGEKAVLGAVVLGDQSFAHALHQLIESRVDISPIRQALVERPEQGVSVLEAFYREWQHADRAA